MRFKSQINLQLIHVGHSMHVNNQKMVTLLPKFPKSFRRSRLAALGKGGLCGCLTIQALCQHTTWAFFGSLVFPNTTLKIRHLKEAKNIQLVSGLYCAFTASVEQPLEGQRWDLLKDEWRIGFYKPGERNLVRCHWASGKEADVCGGNKAHSISCPPAKRQMHLSAPAIWITSKNTTFSVKQTACWMYSQQHKVWRKRPVLNLSLCWHVWAQTEIFYRDLRWYNNVECSFIVNLMDNC